MLVMDPPEQLHFSFKTSTLWYDIKTIKELIETHFRAFGRVKSLWFARILMNSTNTSGYGFVSYETTEEALRAVQVMRQTLLDGIAYDCKFSKAFTESFGQLSLPPHVETSPIVWVPPMPMYPTFYPTFPPSFQQLPHLPSPLAFPQPYPPALPNAVTQQTSSAYPQMPVIHPLAPPPPLLLPQHHHQPHHQHQPQYQHQHQTRSPPLLYSYNNFPQGGHHVVQTPPYYWLGP